MAAKTALFPRKAVTTFPKVVRTFLKVVTAFSKVVTAFLQQSLHCVATEPPFMLNKDFHILKARLSK